MLIVKNKKSSQVSCNQEILEDNWSLYSQSTKGFITARAPKWASISRQSREWVIKGTTSRSVLPSSQTIISSLLSTSPRSCSLGEQWRRSGIIIIPEITVRRLTIKTTFHSNSHIIVLQSNSSRRLPFRKWPGLISIPRVAIISSRTQGMPKHMHLKA